MNALQTLQIQAIKAAERQDWVAAVAANTEILEQDKDNVSALNRLGFCYMQKGDKNQAKEVYNHALRIDPYNSIAKRYLSLLETSKAFIPTSAGAFHESFIEEPGKTKTISLCRPADPSVLTSVPVATTCKLVVRQHRIAIETEENVYLGSLPDDLSHNLTKLIKGGNTYKAVVKSISKTSCVVLLKELSRSKRQAHIISFPVTVNNHASGLHEELLVDNTPVDVSETGQEHDGFDDFEEPAERDRSME